MSEREAALEECINILNKLRHKVSVREADDMAMYLLCVGADKTLAAAIRKIEALIDGS